MSKPIFHAKSSARRYGGVPEDYLDIHQLMDSSKNAIGSNIHRALTHNTWFVCTILELVFGVERTNSDGKTYSTKQIGEDHCQEDLGCIPTAQDYFESTEYKSWMHGEGQPPSYAPIMKAKVTQLKEYLKEKEAGVDEETKEKDAHVEHLTDTESKLDKRSKID